MFMRFLPLSVILLCGPTFAADTKSTTLVVNVAPTCAVDIVSAPYLVDPLKNEAAGQIFFRYSVRTSRYVGSGSINLGPLDVGRNITFSARLAGLGSPVTGRTVATGQSVIAATFGADSHTM